MKRELVRGLNIQGISLSNAIKGHKLSFGEFVNKSVKRNPANMGRIASAMIFLLIIMPTLIGNGLSQPISVTPELPGSVQNNGSDRVIVEWNYPYSNYRVTYYDLVFVRGANKGIVAQSYNVSDISRGRSSPLNGSYVWNVPMGTPEGRYKAELQIRTVEAGGEVHDTISRAFDIARDVGDLRIFKFNDSNENAEYDQGENGLPGWQFIITTPTGERYPRETSSDGFIVIKGLPVGTYIIEEAERSGYKPTTDLRKSAQVMKDRTANIVFGNKPLPAIIKIVKFEDKNQNKVQDADEPGIAGWEFSIQGPSTFAAMTDSDGTIYKQVSPGKYRITEIPKSPEDWKATTQIEQSITLEQGQTIEIKFGNWKIPPGTLTVLNFEDSNRNGIYDEGERGLPDWEFSIEGKEAFKEITGSDGSIARALHFGTYKIRQALKPGWLSTIRTEQNATINPGEEAKVYFGNVGPQLITKFEDKNANGNMDAGEQGLANWTFDIKGPETTTRSTDANGQININDLPAGEYTVTEHLADPTWYNTTPINLVVNVPGPDIYFGNDRYHTLKVFKFNDSNRNGEHDDNESGLVGWEFQVNGGAGQALTDSMGVATFKVKANEKYLISESLPVGWLNSTPLEVEIQIDPAKDEIEILFGDYLEDIQTPRGSIINAHAFNDTNRNGEMDQGEPELPNREIRILEINDTSNAYEPIITNSSGDAEFILPATGTYLIEQILPGNWCSNGEVFSYVTVQAGESAIVNFGSYPCGVGNCEYRYKPHGTNLTSTVQDENLVIRKSVDPYVLSLPEHDMVNGSLINYTITVCAKPKLGPTDLILAVDTSGSVIEGDKAALSEISRGINGFVEAMKKSSNPNLRIGLVSWDKDIDATVKPTLNYSYVLNASGRLSANSQELTMYNVGMNGSLTAFDSLSREDVRKVIVFITDARNEYEPFLKYPDQNECTIYVLLIGRPQVNETYEMLNDTANRFNGKLIPVENSSQIASNLKSLTQTSLMANGTINDIKIVDTLPTYLRPLNSGTIPGVPNKNPDGVNWKTTSLVWSIPSLKYGECRSTTFTTVFCWKLQANVAQPANSPRATSQVDYSDPTKAGRKIINLPEGTIWLESSVDISRASIGNPARADGAPGTTRGISSPGLEVLIGLIGFLSAAYLLRRR